MTSLYETLTGGSIDLSELTPKGREAFQRAFAEFQENPPWDAFSAAWIRRVEGVLRLPAAERVAHPLYRACQDLEMRLGISQGQVAPPDYRDYIVDRIEEKFGSRYKFCKATGIPEAFLSQVLSGKKDFSLEKLRQVAGALGLGLVMLPLADLADLPLTDSAALRRVCARIGEELATLKTARDHFSRIKNPEQRLKALEDERDLFGPAFGWLTARLTRAPARERADAILGIIDEEADRLDSILSALRERLACLSEPAGPLPKGGVSRVSPPLSRV